MVVHIYIILQELLLEKRGELERSIEILPSSAIDESIKLASKLRKQDCTLLDTWYKTWAWVPDRLEHIHHITTRVRIRCITTYIERVKLSIKNLRELNENKPNCH